MELELIHAKMPNAYELLFCKNYPEVQNCLELGKREAGFTQPLTNNYALQSKTSLNNIEPYGCEDVFFRYSVLHL